MSIINTLFLGGSGQIGENFINENIHRKIISVDKKNPIYKNDNCTFIKADITDDKQLSFLINYIKENEFYLDEIVFSIGINPMHNFFSSDIQTFENTIEINFITVYKILKKTYEYFQDKISIVIISSQNGVVGHEDRIDYGSSKAALIHLVKNLSLDFAKYSDKDIKVNSVSPGYIITNINEKYFSTRSGRKIIDSIPYKKLVTVKDVVQTIEFLLSDKSTAIRGQNIILDYGYTIK